MPGRKPTPTALKILRGNPGKRPLNEREPKPPLLDPAIPPELRSREGKAEWRRTVVDAIRIGQITKADRAAALMYCERYAAWREAERRARRAPYLVKNGDVSYINPLRTLAKQAAAELEKSIANLGLSPTARSRVSAVLDAAAAADPRERFFD